MITVRFPSGFSITYNDANYLVYNKRQLPRRLYSNKTRNEIIAVVPDEAIIEFVSPCCMSNPAQGLTTSCALDHLLNHLRNIKGWSDESRKLADLKRALDGFSLRNREWKP